jgi:hypothetical protein
MQSPLFGYLVHDALRYVLYGRVHKKTDVSKLQKQQECIASFRGSNSFGVQRKLSPLEQAHYKRVIDFRTP